MANNSIKQVVTYLTVCPFKSENEICEAIWGYDRKTSWRDNKKYADLIRRGLKKGLISRVKANVKGSRSRYFYFVPNK